MPMQQHTLTTVQAGTSSCSHLIRPIDSPLESPESDNNPQDDHLLPHCNTVGTAVLPPAEQHTAKAANNVADHKCHELGVEWDIRCLESPAYPTAAAVPMAVPLMPASTPQQQQEITPEPKTPAAASFSTPAASPSPQPSAEQPRQHAVVAIEAADCGRSEPEGNKLSHQEIFKVVPDSKPLSNITIQDQEPTAVEATCPAGINNSSTRQQPLAAAASGETYAGFTSSVSSKLATKAARSLWTTSSSSKNKKRRLQQHKTALISSTGQPTAVQLKAAEPLTPEEAAAAVEAAAAATAAAMGYSVDQEVSKLRMSPPSDAKMNRLADVDPASHPTAWQFLSKINDEGLVISGQQSQKNVVMVINELSSVLGKNSIKFEVAQNVIDNSQQPAAAAAAPEAAAAAAASSPDDYSSKAKCNAIHTATVIISYHKQTLYSMQGSGPSQREAKRAAAAAALEQILTDVPALVLNKVISRLNPQFVPLAEQQKQEQQQQEAEDFAVIARSVTLLDPRSAHSRQQKQQLELQQQQLEKKAKAEIVKREARLAREQVLQQQRDQADKLAALEDFPLLKQHVTTMLAERSGTSSASTTGAAATTAAAATAVPPAAAAAAGGGGVVVGVCQHVTPLSVLNHYQRELGLQVKQKLVPDTTAVEGGTSDLFTYEFETYEQVHEQQDQQQTSSKPIARAVQSAHAKQTARQLAAADILEQLLQSYAPVKAHAAAQAASAASSKATWISQSQIQHSAQAQNGTGAINTSNSYAPVNKRRRVDMAQAGRNVDAAWQGQPAGPPWQPGFMDNHVRHTAVAAVGPQRHHPLQQQQRQFGVSGPLWHGCRGPMKVQSHRPLAAAAAAACAPPRRRLPAPPPQPFSLHIHGQPMPGKTPFGYRSGAATVATAPAPARSYTPQPHDAQQQQWMQYQQCVRYMQQQQQQQRQQQQQQLSSHAWLQQEWQRQQRQQQQLLLCQNVMAGRRF